MKDAGKSRNPSPQSSPTRGEEADEGRQNSFPSPLAGEG